MSQNNLTIPAGNISRKMLQAKMIQTGKKLSYHNSRIQNYVNVIAHAKYDENRALLFRLGYDLYIRYFNKIIKSNNISAKIRNKANEVYSEILDSLTYDEKVQLGMIIEEEEVEEVIAEDLVDQVIFTFYVIVRKFGKKYNFMLKNHTKTFSFIPGQVYKFDLSDSSNSGHKLSLSLSEYTNTPFDTVYYSGTPGDSDSYMIFAPSAQISSYEIYMFNLIDDTYDNVWGRTEQSIDDYYVYGYVYNPLSVKVNYQAVTKGNLISSYEPPIECLNQYNKLSTTESSGPKIIIEDIDAEPKQGISNKYITNKKYGLYFGTYYINVHEQFKFTILNLYNSEFIKIEGNDYITDEIKGTDFDGSYNFYYNDIKISVYGDFEYVSIYTHNFGFIEGDNMFIFSATCDTYSSPSPDEEYDDYKYSFTYTDDDSVNYTVECLYPQCNLVIGHDTSEYDGDDIETFNRYKRIILNNRTEYPGDYHRYGMSVGQYMIFGIPRENPIAFINNGKEEYFEYTGNEDFSIVALGPDGKKYKYYYGTVIVYVYGDFGVMSMYGFYNGYMGGYYILEYASSCDFNTPWAPDDDLELDDYEITNEIGPESTVRECVTNYSQFNIVLDSNGSEYITLNGQTEYNSFKRFGLYDGSYNYESLDAEGEIVAIGSETIDEDARLESGQVGVYVIEDIPEDYPIAIINYAKTDRIRYNGYTPYKLTGTGPDGFTYDFYYGNVNIFVYGNFGKVSIYVLNKGYMGGKKLLEYAVDCQQGVAIESFSSISNRPLVSTEIDSTISQTYHINVNVETVDAPYYEAYDTYIMSGQDRNGVLRSSQQPKLSFLQGDTVKFYLDYDYKSENLFDIFINIAELSDSQQITTVEEEDRLVITWRPVNIGTNAYYYRSHDYMTTMYNGIDIDDNPNVELKLSLDLSNIPLIGQSEVAIYTLITLAFDDTTNLVPDGGSIKLINTTEDETSYEIIPSDSSTYVSLNVDRSSTSYTFYLGFSRPLDFDASYSIQIEDNVFQNIYGNYFEGVSTNDVLYFSTETSHPPIIQGISPENLSVNNINFSIDVSFNEIVYIGDGYFYLSKVDGDGSISEVTMDKNLTTGSGSTQITLSTTDYLDTDSSYVLLYTEGAVIDVSNISIPEITDSSHVFQTISGEYYDENRPTLDSTNPFYPESGSTGNDTVTEITLTFDRDMYAYDGYVYIIDIAGQTFHQIIQDVASSSSVSGDGTTQITITPTTAFTYGKKYSIQFDETSLRDENYFFFNSLSDYKSLIQTEYDYEFTIKDSADDPPVIQSYYPENGSIDINVDVSFTITFDENIYFNTDYIRIRDLSDNGNFYVLSLEDDKDTYITGEGSKTLTFTFKTDLDYDTSYSISIDASAIYDYEGNYFTDLSNIDIYTFRTVSDIFPPAIVSIDPSYNNTEVIKDLSMIEIVFDDIPILDASSSFYLYDITNDALIDTIDISNDTSKYELTNNTNLTLKFDHEFEYDTSYSVYMDISAIQDEIGNVFTDLSSVGNYVFKIIPPDITGPTLLTIDPSYNNDVVKIDGTVFTLTFDENAYIDTSYNSSVYIEKIEDSSMVEIIDICSNAVGSGSQIIEITSSAQLEYDTSYTLYMDVSAIVDQYDNAFLDLSLSSIYSFKTVPEFILNDTIPSEGELINVNDTIMFEFSSDVFMDSSDIVIYDLSSGEVFERINVVDDSQQIIVSENTLVIDVSQTFDYDTSYSIVFEYGSVKDINDTQFTDLSSEGNLIFRTFAFDCLRKINRLEVIDDTYLSINTRSYSSTRKFALYDGIYLLENIPIEYPITILNTSEIQINVVDESPIIIKIYDGSESANDNGDYYTFLDSNDEQININNGDFKFMRGRTYRFSDFGISTSYPFKVFANGSSTSGLSGSLNGDNYFDIVITEDHSTEEGNLYYYSSKSDTIASNMTLLYADFSGDDTIPDGSYSFYYGSITISVSGEFEPTSIYTYDNGFMGMENTLRYESVCEIKSGFVNVSTNDTYRVFETNNWPNFDNFDTYVQSYEYGGNNIPEKREPNLVFQVPITPSYPDGSAYNYFDGEFATSTEIDLSDGDLTDVAMQFWVIGVVGRLYTPNKHWSRNYTPEEIVIVEPGPAGCGGNSDATEVLTAIDCGQTWDNTWVYQDENGAFTETDSITDVSDTALWYAYKPGYYYRYHLPYVNENMTDSLAGFQMDSYGGHVQPDGDWHVHLATMFIDSSFNDCVVGYAFDGTPIIGGSDSTVYNEDGSESYSVTSSWRQRTSDEYTDTYALDGSGYYHYDYIFDEGSGTLDQFNGGYAMFENSDGDIEYHYAYFITSTYPVWPRNLRGKTENILVRE
jgi:hypothetical protein